MVVTKVLTVPSFPLHKACVLQPTEAVAAALVHAYPEGSKSHDQDGWLPIHCACFYGANESH
jgi:hypothetical protein